MKNKNFFFIILFWFFLSGKADFTISFANEGNLIYSNGEKQSFFDFNGLNSFSCQVPDVYRDRSESNTINIQNHDDQNYYTVSVSWKTDKNVASLKFDSPSFEIPRGSLKQISFNYECEDLTNSDLFYTVVEITLYVEDTAQTFDFSYIKVCNERDYIFYRFDYSLILVVIIVAFLISMSLRICKIMTLKKKPKMINIGFVGCFVYFILLIPFLILLNYKTIPMVIFFKVVISIIAFLSFCFVFHQSLGNLMIRSSLFGIGFKIPNSDFEITLFMIIGGLIGIAFIVPLGITNNWILSDIVALTLFIAAINFLKVTKFKNGLFLMFVQIAADILWMILFNYEFNKDFSHSQAFADEKQYNDFFGSKFTVPLKIECIFFEPKYNLNSKCSWIGISNLIIPSLLISYFNRYDNYVNATIYSVMSIIGYLLGLMIWIIVQSQISIIIPLSIYCNTLMCLLLGILAFKRNEHYEIWNGLFPDMGKDDPLIKSQDLMKESGEKKISDEDINYIKPYSHQEDRKSVV